MGYAVISNPSAGNGYAKKILKETEERLAGNNIEFSVYTTDAPGQATAYARELTGEAAPEGIIVIGGDGTINECAGGLARTGIPMGIVPGGTGNDFIKSLKIPSSPHEALNIILQKKETDVDTGNINGDTFVNVCGCGFDVTVLDYAEKMKRHFRGLLPYFLGLILAIHHYRPIEAKLVFDGHEEEGKYMMCSVANGKYIGGGIPVCPDASVQDGLLDIVLVRDVPRWKIPFYLPGLMMSRILRYKITRHSRVRQVRIQGKQLRVNIDGEIRTMDSADFSVCPGSLRVFVPNA